MAPHRVRLAGAVVLLVLQVGALGAVLWVSRSSGMKLRPVLLGSGPAAGGTVIVEHLADDTLFVTAERGLQALRVDPQMRVETLDGAGEISDLRPGSMLWVRDTDLERGVIGYAGVIG